MQVLKQLRVKSGDLLKPQNPKKKPDCTWAFLRIFAPGEEDIQRATFEDMGTIPYQTRGSGTANRRRMF